MRLIDADRLIDEFEDTIGNPISRTRLKLQVQNQPTVDAVEVVRCEDCKLTETDGTEVLWCEKMFDLHGFCEEVKPNHYCGYGKRKEETDG